MVEFGWIQMYFLLLQITGAQNRQYLVYIFVRVGDEVTLPCENVIGNKCNCDGTTWMFIGPRHTASVELVKLGRTESDPVSKPDRLSLTENCSLVIKKVTVEDVGRYSCRQFDRSGRQQGPDTDVYLSVVTKTEHEDGDKVTLNCSVLTDGRCRYTVKWQLKDVDQDNKDLTTSQFDCSASVSFTTSHFIHMPENYGSLKCEVTDGYTGKVQQFSFSPQTSGQKTVCPGEEPKSAPTTKSTTARTTEKSTVTVTTNQTGSLNKDTNETLEDWWCIIAAVGLVALVVTVVALVRWRRTKANKTWIYGNIGPTSIPAVTQSAPETSQEDSDDEDTPM